MNYLLSIGRDLMCIGRALHLSMTKTIDMKSPLIWHESHDSSKVIVLVHGSSSDQSQWLLFESLIKKYLHHPIVAFSLDWEYNSSFEQQHAPLKSRNHFINMKRLATYNNFSVEEYADRLTQRLAWVNDRWNPEELVLIGTSMGGLIARYCQLHHVDRPCKVVTISSPLQGAPLLSNKSINYFLQTKRHRDMTPDSKFLSQLNHTDKPFYSFGSEHDLQVPNHCAHLHSQHHTVKGYGHMSINFNEDMWRKIGEIIKTSD